MKESNPSSECEFLTEGLDRSKLYSEPAFLSIRFTEGHCDGREG